MVKSNKLKFMIFPLFLILVALVGMKLYNGYQQEQLESQPITELKCEFIGEVTPSEQLRSSMFRVQAVTNSGIMFDIQSYSIDVKNAPKNGSEFNVTVTYQEKSNVMTVPIKRNPVTEYKIGYPEPENVKATIYSNGDLEFSGSGNTMSFRDGDVPWKDEDYTHVYFSGMIEPGNIDYWFKGNRNLVQCQDLPKSIESMRGTFSGCISLTESPNFFQCTKLRIMTDVFNGCINLKTTDVLPVATVNADAAFKDCKSLLLGPDMTKTTALTSINSICAGDTSLTAAPMIPESVIEMSKAFEGCSNIHTAAAFPKLVENISYSYADCSSLEKGASIPESVNDCKGCYSGCTDLNGNLEINTDTKNNTGILYKSVQSGKKLTLSGNSGRLIEIQQNSANKDIQLLDVDEASRQFERMTAELEVV